MAVEALVAPAEFVGLDGITHLCTGSEGPWLKRLAAVYEQFSNCKGAGMRGRHQVLERVQGCRSKMAALWQVPEDRIGFMPSAAEGMNWLARGLALRRGDNIVTTRMEFPSVAYAWRSARERGVEVRMVPHRNWIVAEDDLVAAIDSQTRVVAVSQVSFYSGQCLDVARLSAAARKWGALLAVDATHASGVVQVPAGLTDLCVSSCYKWLLATHGVAPCYLSERAEAAAEPTCFGWHNLEVWGGDTCDCDPEVATKPMPDLLEAGNPSLICIMFLERALDLILDLGVDRIEDHARELAARMGAGLIEMGRVVITPEQPPRRSGNTCFADRRAEQLVAQLAQQRILVGGDLGRVRVSTHLHNSSEDVDRCLAALRRMG
jgi:selenocysteine lyase/cysteine desulfurase